MQEAFNIEQEWFDARLMAQAYAFSGTDELPRLRHRSPDTAPCDGCREEYPVHALFTRSAAGALCNDCEDQRLLQRLTA